MFGERIKFLFVFAFVWFGTLLSVVSCSSREERMDQAFNPAGLKYVAAKPDVQETFALRTLFFDTDSETIRSDQYAVLRYNANWLKQNPNAQVQIEGHCDIRGTELYNYELGERRAIAAKKFLVKLGVEESRIDTVSYGRRPGDAAYWGKNRRVTFEVSFPEGEPMVSKIGDVKKDQAE